MKFVLALIIIMSQTRSIPGIAEVRKLYKSAAVSEKSCRELANLLNSVNASSPAVLIGYKGANEMLKAKYAINPIMKFRNFNVGKKNIEEAVQKDSRDVEIRFIRYSIQTNLPGFLRYNSNIKADRKMLLENTAAHADPVLKETIVDFFRINNATEPELKRLKQQL